MEKDYHNNLLEFGKKSKTFFETQSKSNIDLMNTTKQMVQRIRLDRQVDFTEDFRKKYFQKDYGNYAKYENNEIKLNIDKMKDDTGMD